jgi:protein-S-isoprenylcysteine O-methyltransferase Ste14
MALCFFGTAGTTRWIEAWVYLVAQFCVSLFFVVWLKKNDPALLRERMTFMKKSGKTWDKFVVLGFTVLSVPFYVLPGFDAVRYHWSHVPLAAQIVALVASIAGVSMFVLAARANTFLTPLIEIQRDRGHRAISTGPYAYVRHPMYAGMLIHLICLPIFLGSLWTLVVSAALCVLLLVRTYFEDKTLQRELEGYTEYALRVRYRIVPGVW